MILPAAGLDGLEFLDFQQPGPLIDHLLKMPQCQPLSRSLVDENVPLLPVAHIIAQHLAVIAGQLHGLGCTRDVAPGPAVVLALGLGDAQDSISCALGKSEYCEDLAEGDLAGSAVPQLDPGALFQNPVIPTNIYDADATTNPCKSVKSVSFYISRHGFTLINTDFT